MIYYVVFAVSIFFAYFAVGEKNSKSKQMIYLSISILLPVVLAAERDIVIGTDIRFYVKPLFDLAVKYNNFGMYFFLNRKDIEPMYIVVTFIVAHFLKDIGWMFAINQLCISIPIYFVLWNRRKQSDFVAGIITYYMCVYNYGLNWTRQTIAAGFLMVAIMYFYEKEYKKYIFFQLIAIFYHSSAVMGLVIILILVMGRSKNKLLYGLISIFGYFLIILTFKPVMQFLINNFNFFPKRYLLYVDIFSEFDISIADTLLYLLAMISAFLNKKDDEYGFLLKEMGILSFLGVFLDGAGGNLVRLFWYFRIFIIQILPFSANFFKRDKINRIIYYICLFVGLGSIFGYKGIIGFHEIWPYKFRT